MSNLIESMINENVQFSESKKVKKTTDKKVVKESKKRRAVKESLDAQGVSDLIQEFSQRKITITDLKHVIRAWEFDYESRYMNAIDRGLSPDAARDEARQGAGLYESKKRKKVKESVNRKTYHISNIVWDIEEEDLDLDRDDFGPGSDYYETFEQEKQKIEDSLPSEFDVEIDIDDDDTEDDINEKIDEAVSDETGWLTLSFDYDEVAKEACRNKKRVKESVDGKDELYIILKNGKVYDAYTTYNNLELTGVYEDGTEPADIEERYSRDELFSLTEEPMVNESTKKKRVKEATDENGYEVPLYTKYITYKGNDYDISLWEDGDELTIDIGEYESGPHTQELLKADFIFTGKNPGWFADSVEEGKELVRKWVDLYDEWSSKHEESFLGKRKVKEAVGGKDEIYKDEVYVVVEDGMVQDIYVSTSLNLDINVIDLDTDDLDVLNGLDVLQSEIRDRVKAKELKKVW